MNTDTTRRFARTTEQAFGPNAWPISGPYRRGSRALRKVIVTTLSTLGGLALLLGALGLAVR